MTNAVVLFCLTIITLFIIVDDMRHYRIRNDVVLGLMVIFVASCVLEADWMRLGYHLIFAAVMFALIIGLYALGLMGGGDAKLLGASFLWIGAENAMIFAIIILIFTLIYGAFAKFGLAAHQIVNKRMKIPFGPSIAAALLSVVLADLLFH